MRNDVEDTAVPFPYCGRSIVGTQHCCVLILGKINSDTTGIDIIRVMVVWAIELITQQLFGGTPEFWRRRAKHSGR